jgi:TPP-dependent 2-oxoacid decarboxylase
MSEIQHTIGTYLIQRIYDYGVRHIFGVPVTVTESLGKKVHQSIK